ncbi:MAG: alpha/beta family hydrolase, partial [Kangiellaceae bacterium]
MVKQTKSLLLFAHGAGAGKDSEFMVSMANQLESKQITVSRFNFPYMSIMTEQGKRR